MRTISSTASSATIMALRVAQVSKNSISEIGSSVVVRRWRRLIHHLRDGDGLVVQLELGDGLAPLEHLMKRLDQIHERDDHLAFDRVAGIEGAVRPRPDVGLDLLLFIQELRGVFELFVFEQAVHQLVARVLLLRSRERIGRKKHLRFDVDQRRRHVDEVSRDVDIQLFELVEIIEILLGDLGDGNIVNVHLLLADQIEQEIERAFVRPAN